MNDTGVVNPYYSNYAGYHSTEPVDDISDHSDRPLHASSTEQLYKRRDTAKSSALPPPNDYKSDLIDSTGTGQKRRKKRVTIGGTEEVDDWGGDHPQTDSQVEVCHNVRLGKCESVFFTWLLDRLTHLFSYSHCYTGFDITLWLEL